MATNRPTPSVGLRGVWTLIDPFLNALSANTAYTCRAVQQLGHFTALGRDAYTDVYEPKDITPEKYQQDLDEGVLIVSLQSDNGSWIHVPNSYIARYPEQGGVAYTSLLISGLLGAVPDHLDLTGLKLRFADMIKETMGFENPQVEVVAVSTTTMISKDESDRLEEARRDRITTQYTDQAEIQRLKDRVAALETERDALIQFIEANP